MAESISLHCLAPDCDYETAAMPPQFGLCQLSMHHRLIHGVDSTGGLHPMGMMGTGMGMWIDGNKVVWNQSARITGTLIGMDLERGAGSGSGERGGGPPGES